MAFDYTLADSELVRIEHIKDLKAKLFVRKVSNIGTNPIIEIEKGAIAAFRIAGTDLAATYAITDDDTDGENDSVTATAVAGNTLVFGYLIPDANYIPKAT